MRQNQKTVLDGWHGPVVQKTRPAPKRCFGKLELATKENYCGRITPTLIETNSRQTESSCEYDEVQRTPLLSRRKSLVRKDGWIEIPIQRI